MKGEDRQVVQCMLRILFLSSSPGGCKMLESASPAIENAYKDSGLMDTVNTSFTLDKHSEDLKSKAQSRLFGKPQRQLC